MGENDCGDDKYRRITLIANTSSKPVPDRQRSCKPADYQPIGAKMRLGESDVGPCRCLGTNDQPRIEPSNGSSVAGSLKVVTTNPQFKFMLDSDYGAYCRVHDEPGRPECSPFGTSDTGPGFENLTVQPWCYAQWCYVDPCTCNTQSAIASFDIEQSDYFPDQNLWYSYGACGYKNTYDTYVQVTVTDDAYSCVQTYDSATGTTSTINTQAACEAVTNDNGRSICEWTNDTISSVSGYNDCPSCTAALCDPVAQPGQCGTLGRNDSVNPSDVCAGSTVANQGVPFPSDDTCNTHYCIYRPGDLESIADAKRTQGQCPTSLGGKEGCPCIRRNGQPRLEDGLHISAAYLSVNDQFHIDVTRMQMLDATYGEHCTAHAEPADRRCIGMFPEAWCEKAWCYVDPCSCDASDIAQSRMFADGGPAGAPLFYSYQACGEANLDEITPFGLDRAKCAYLCEGSDKLVGTPCHVHDAGYARLPSLLAPLAALLFW